MPRHYFAASAMQGRSAGGLTMGASLNLRPDLYKAAILGVPFVDVLTTMLDDTIPLTTTEVALPSFWTAHLQRFLEKLHCIDAIYTVWWDEDMARKLATGVAAMQWEEWGCPKDKQYYEYMKSYSPVDNIKRAAYPNILVTAGV